MDYIIIIYLHKNIFFIFQGFSLNCIVDKSKFCQDEREVVISAIQRLEPEFKPVYTPPILHYTGELVEYLNTNRPTIKSITSNENSGVMSEQKYSDQFYNVKNLQMCSKQQLNLEMNGIVVVKSIEKLPEPDEFVLHYVRRFF